MESTSIARLVAGEVRAEMARQQLTGRQLAARLSRPTNTVGRWVRGETPMGFDELDLVARALRVSALELLSRSYAVSSVATTSYPLLPAVGSSEGGVNSGWRSRKNGRRSVIRTNRHGLRIVA